jgi:hypothetical protein
MELYTLNTWLIIFRREKRRRVLKSGMSPELRMKIYEKL